MTGLFDALVDDAGLFPPTALPLPQALARHRRDLATGSRVLTHRFLCPASRLDELRAAPSRPDRIGVVVDTPALPSLAGLPVDLIEVRLPPDGPPLPAGDHALFVEVAPARLPMALPAGAGLKVRCGGLTAADFPSVQALGGFIAHCVRHDVRFKATAGLHHAVRHFDPALGVDRHGFLNLVLAVCAAVEGDDPEPVLASTDVGALARLATAVPARTAERARAHLLSYGSCSTSAPVTDLIALGLVEKE